MKTVGAGHALLPGQEGGRGKGDGRPDVSGFSTLLVGGM